MRIEDIVNCGPPNFINRFLLEYRYKKISKKMKDLKERFGNNWRPIFFIKHQMSIENPHFDDEFYQCLEAYLHYVAESSIILAKMRIRNCDANFRIALDPSYAVDGYCKKIGNNCYLISISVGLIIAIIDAQCFYLGTKRIFNINFSISPTGRISMIDNRFIKNREENEKVSADYDSFRFQDYGPMRSTFPLEMPDFPESLDDLIEIDLLLRNSLIWIIMHEVSHCLLGHTDSLKCVDQKLNLVNNDMIDFIGTGNKSYIDELQADYLATALNLIVEKDAGGLKPDTRSNPTFFHKINESDNPIEAEFNEFKAIKEYIAAPISIIQSIRLRIGCSQTHPEPSARLIICLLSLQEYAQKWMIENENKHPRLGTVGIEKLFEVTRTVVQEFNNIDRTSNERFREVFDADQFFVDERNIECLPYIIACYSLGIISFENGVGPFMINKHHPSKEEIEKEIFADIDKKLRFRKRELSAIWKQVLSYIDRVEKYLS